MHMNMNRISCRALLVLSLTAAIQIRGIAQEYVSTPVEISTEKVRYNDKVCYSHLVLEKQTLFSISKAYGVTMEEIYNVNPTLRETGLKKGAFILVPVAPIPEPEVTVTEAAETVAEAVAEAENAGQKNAAKVREDAAKTQKKEKKAAAKEERKSGRQTIHIRKWYESIEEIAARYGVTAEDIVKANDLRGKRLTNRQKLVIPDLSSTSAEVQTDTIATTIDTTSATDTTQAVPVQDTIEAVLPISLYPKERVRTSLILPLKADGTGSSRNNMDFYSGVLLAVKDMAEDGIGIDLDVHDCAANGSADGMNLEDCDLVIGPVSSGEIGRVLSVMPENLMLVSPLDPRAERLAGTHPDMVQAPTPHEAQYRDLVAWIKEDMTPEDTVVFITETGVRSEVATQMKELMDSLSIACNSFSYSILEGRDVTVPLTELMSKTGTSRVLIGSDSEAFVNDVVRNLNLLVYNKVNLVLYATSRIRGFDTIETENFHNTSMHVSLTYYIDYDDPRVKSFLMRYRALFNTEPTQFAFQGYDIARYFIPMVYRYGNRWTEMLTESEKAMLQSTFACRRSGDGGYVNQGVRRIIYGPEWTVERVR